MFVQLHISGLVYHKCHIFPGTLEAYLHASVNTSHRIVNTSRRIVNTSRRIVNTSRRLVNTSHRIVNTSHRIVNKHAAFAHAFLKAFFNVAPNYISHSDSRNLAMFSTDCPLKTALHLDAH